MVYKLTIESCKQSAKTRWIRSFIIPNPRSYEGAYRVEHQNRIKVPPIKLKLIGGTTNVNLYNCWKFHAKRPLFSNYTKITWTPLCPIYYRQIVIFGDNTCPGKLQDPKVLIASPSSTRLVVFEKKNSANSIALIWRKPITKISYFWP
jgi:hypothetical protein